MSLINFYDQLSSSTTLGNNSPVYRSHKFKLAVNDNMLVNGEKLAIKEIHGIVDQLPEISYSTEWDLSPVSTLTKKVEDFTSNNLIRAIASNNKNYRPPLFTDGWTQKMTKAGSPLSLDFTFRSYPIKEMFNTTMYKDIIHFLIYLTTPQEYNFESSVNVTSTALNLAEQYGKDIGEASKELIEATQGKSITELKDEFANGGDIKDKFNNILKEIENLGNMGTDVGGAPLCSLELGTMIKKSPKINWLIKSWSFKPAINTTLIDSTVNPIYVDFKVAMETQQILTDADLNEIFPNMNN
mgnify:FL=1